MFNFHKPRVYRSTSGCCICRAKSSSSRFTDSRKYEGDLTYCFQLVERRAGEICNACVLLVKRWKKLPEGSNRHWRHVVDYRAGPGSKSLVRSKTRNKKRPKLKAEVRAVSPGGEDDISSDLSVLGALSPASPIAPVWPVKGKQVKRPSAQFTDDCGFVDPTIWKRKKICCGEIFVGLGGIVIVDPRLLKPCHGSCSFRLTSTRSPAQPQPAVTPEKKPSDETDAASVIAVASDKPAPTVTSDEPATVTSAVTPISDSSSDSGYDECSNPTAN